MHAVTIIVIMNALWYKSLNGCSDKKCNLYYSDGSKTETEDDRKYIRQNVNSDVHVSNKYENDSGHVIVSFSALWRWWCHSRPMGQIGLSMPLVLYGHYQSQRKSDMEGMKKISSKQLRMRKKKGGGGCQANCPPLRE